MNVSCVVGTRPEVVKMAPVILRLRRGVLDEVRILSTGQHRSLLDRALADFGLAADDDLELMRPDQTLADLTARAVTALSRAFEERKPDLVLAQGDTTTVFCAALACYYNRIPFGHIEAGLRTGRRYSPFPEEKNRVLAGHLAEVHFAPTAGAASQPVARGDRPDERPHDGQYRDRCSLDDGRPPGSAARHAEHVAILAGDGTSPGEFRRALAGDLPGPPRPGTSLPRPQRRLPRPPESERAPHRRRVARRSRSGSI